MGFKAEVHVGEPGALLQPCSSCSMRMFDYALLPTGDKLCIRCVAEELATAEEEIEVDKARRLEGTTSPA